jgi:hypothetical protein
MPNTEEMCQRISCNIINNDLDTGNHYGVTATHKNDIPDKKVTDIDLFKHIRKISNKKC